ncbi:hypothetical protein [Blastococcus mobilis]|uniref:Uncharacterized protein n=1 Tax=Blastococcus mobilis TaxID=1938746 RepID=A0A238VXG3_9ACTN|nr:hypothetical protein [Blastococcus mobilis]SNR38533.1 hypothetical protein SAMN06272737_10596 [Blastococcus mobilis]
MTPPDELPLDLPAPDPTRLEELARLADHAATTHQGIADEARTRAALMRAQATAVRALAGDDAACRAMMALSRDGWAGTADDLIAVARELAGSYPGCTRTVPGKVDHREAS